MTLGASSTSHCVCWAPRSPQPSPSPGDQGEAKNWTRQLTTRLAANSKSFLGGSQPFYHRTPGGSALSSDHLIHLWGHQDPG